MKLFFKPNFVLNMLLYNRNSLLILKLDVTYRRLPFGRMTDGAKVFRIQKNIERLREGKCTRATPLSGCPDSSAEPEDPDPPDGL